MITIFTTKCFVSGDRLSRTALAALAALLLQGCAERRPHVVPWATAIAVKPRVPTVAPRPVSPPDIDISAPDLRWDGAPPSPLLVSVRGPVRPRTAVVVPLEPSAGAKPESLSLAPQLSDQEVAVAQQQMNDSIAAAQRNLASAKGHHLNATQADMATKVNAFIAESREAARDGDWNRARNLAKKAQVLGDELAGSL